MGKIRDSWGFGGIGAGEPVLDPPTGVGPQPIEELVWAKTYTVDPDTLSLTFKIPNIAWTYSVEVINILSELVSMTRNGYYLTVVLALLPPDDPVTELWQEDNADALSFNVYGYL